MALLQELENSRESIRFLFWPIRLNLNELDPLNSLLCPTTQTPHNSSYYWFISSSFDLQGHGKIPWRSVTMIDALTVIAIGYAWHGLLCRVYLAYYTMFRELALLPSSDDWLPLHVYGLCRSSDGEALASHPGGLGLIPHDFMWDHNIWEVFLLVSSVSPWKRHPIIAPYLYQFPSRYVIAMARQHIIISSVFIIDAPFLT
jgi:hypothetical protein